MRRRGRRGRRRSYRSKRRSTFKGKSRQSMRKRIGIRM